MKEMLHQLLGQGRTMRLIRILEKLFIWSSRRPISWMVQLHENWKVMWPKKRIYYSDCVCARKPNLSCWRLSNPYEGLWGTYASKHRAFQTTVGNNMDTTHIPSCTTVSTTRESYSGFYAYGFSIDNRVKRKDGPEAFAQDSHTLETCRDGPQKSCGFQNEKKTHGEGWC